MSEKTTILVPIRDPFTKKSQKTLRYADELTNNLDHSDCIVLNINLIQNGDHTQRREIINAISPIIENVEPAITVRSGILVEETIAEEAAQTNADLIVIGENQRPFWRGLLSRIIGNDPDLPSYLQENTTATVRVVK